VDPEFKRLTVTRVNKDIASFRKLLDSRAPEREVHRFLQARSYFFNGALRLSGRCPLYSEIRLGHEYVVDFAWCDTGSVGPEWRLVELEGPTRKAFKKSGHPTAWLTHAIDQVRDWHTWVHENLAYARQLMPRIEYPLSCVFVGRRHDLTEATSKRLRRIIFEQRMFMEIHSLDWFVSAAKSVKTLVRGRGYWCVPMHALSHADLSRGLRSETIEYLNLPFVNEHPKRKLRDRLRDRDLLGRDPRIS
jgi:hypothetical protein